MTTITLPLTEQQAQACAAAAIAFGVESWEMAVHLLAWKPGLAPVGGAEQAFPIPQVCPHCAQNIDICKQHGLVYVSDPDLAPTDGEQEGEGQYEEGHAADSLCVRCGAMVGSTHLHNEWHDLIDYLRVQVARGVSDDSPGARGGGS